ncbi:MAG: TadE/TadG family type IV pilus assembly protein [Elusimicrobiota bacterium]
MKIIGGRCKRGQATLETVLLLPIFMFFLFAFAKIFALLILVQKMEIASFYASMRWELESHRNVNYVSDDNILEQDIRNNVMDYLGFNNSQLKGFLSLASANLDIMRTEVWQKVTLTVQTGPVLQIGWMYQSPGLSFKVIKWVPNRDRPIQFILPGSAGPGGGGAGPGG